jgi:hypothetical protein
MLPKVMHHAAMWGQREFLCKQTQIGRKSGDITRVPASAGAEYLL